MTATYARSLSLPRPDCNARGGGQGAMRDSDLSRVLAERIIAVNDSRPAEPWDENDEEWVLEFAGIDPMEPRCKCGEVCEYYGPTGGYSVQCKPCNDVKNEKARARRKRAKEKKQPPPQLSRPLSPIEIMIDRACGVG